MLRDRNVPLVGASSGHHSESRVSHSRNCAQLLSSIIRILTNRRYLRDTGRIYIVREHGRVVVNVAHGDVDEGGIDEYTVARLYRQGDPVVGGVGHIDRALDSHLAGVRIDGEQPQLIPAH